MGQLRSVSRQPRPDYLVRQPFGELRGPLRQRMVPVPKTLVGDPAPGIDYRGPVRPGDVRHSQADTTAARLELGHAPRFDLEEGLSVTLAWYKANNLISQRS